MSAVITRRGALALGFLFLVLGALSGTGCSRKADAATVQAIQTAYGKQDAAYGMRDAAGVLSVCHPNYEDSTDDGTTRRPEYDRMLQELLANTQSCSIHCEVIEARLDGENSCRVTVARQIQANVFSPEDRQMHQIAMEEMNRDIWERVPGKGWLKRKTSVIRQTSPSGMVLSIHGTVHVPSRPTRVRAPRIRLRRM